MQYFLLLKNSTIRISQPYNNYITNYYIAVFQRFCKNMFYNIKIKHTQLLTKIYYLCIELKNASP